MKIEHKKIIKAFLANKITPKESDSWIVIDNKIECNLYIDALGERSACLYHYNEKGLKTKNFRKLKNNNNN